MKNFVKNGYALLLIAMFAVVACAESSADEGIKETSSLSAKVAGAEGKTVYLEELTPTEIKPVDTAQVAEDGSFKFEFTPGGPGFYRIMFDQNNFLVFIMNDGENAAVGGDLSNLYKTYTVQGSPESQRLRELNKMLFPRDSLNMVMQNARMQQDQQGYMTAATQQQTVMVEIDRKIKDFINRSPGSLSSLAALQNLDINSDYAYYKQVVEGLEGKANNNVFFQQMKQQVDQQKLTAVGSAAPEINLPQPDGELLALSSLKGQYVLIDFWASWCGPCRRENPNVKRVYSKYHDKGFEIYGVSLDKTKNAWTAAIEADGLEWKHVSDLKYWQSSVVPKYGVKGIPLTVLLDPEGNIIAKNLRGPQLEAKLAEIFSE